MLRETVVVRTLVELADNLTDNFDVVMLLTTLSERCVEAFDVDAAGVMLANTDGTLQVVASSSDEMRLLELFELQSNQGPCIDSYRDAKPVVNVDLGEAGGRWPQFASKATAAGFGSAHSLPLRLRGQTLGALNMFRRDLGVLGDDDVIAAQAFADIASIALIQHGATADAHVLANQLSQALQSRIIIEQAKGRVSQAAGVDMNEAFERLRSHARSNNLRLTDLASGIANGTLSPTWLSPGTVR